MKKSDTKSGYFSELAKDTALVTEILEAVETDFAKWEQPVDIAVPELLTLESDPNEFTQSYPKSTEILSLQVKEPNQEKIRGLLNGDFVIDSDFEEAIIKKIGRPVIRVVDDDLLEDDIRTHTQKKLLLDTNHKNITQVLPSVGRIELTGHRHDWVGTGWVVDTNVIVTNRHVCKEFAISRNNTYRFRQNLSGQSMTAFIDFREEYGRDTKAEFSISDILYIEPEGGPDLAFLKVNWISDDEARPLCPMHSGQIDKDMDIAVVGYPARIVVLECLPKWIVSLETFMT